MIADLAYGVLLGSFFVLLGFFLWRKGSMSFLAGYAKGKIRNERLMAKRVGIVIILFGFETIILIAISLFITEVEGLVYGIVAVLHILVILFLMILTQMGGAE